MKENQSRKVAKVRTHAYFQHIAMQFAPLPLLAFAAGVDFLYRRYLEMILSRGSRRPFHRR